MLMKVLFMLMYIIQLFYLPGPALTVSIHRQDTIQEHFIFNCNNLKDGGATNSIFQSLKIQTI